MLSVEVLATAWLVRTVPAALLSTKPDVMPPEPLSATLPMTAERTPVEDEPDRPKAKFGLMAALEKAELSCFLKKPEPRITLALAVSNSTSCTRLPAAFTATRKFIVPALVVSAKVPRLSALMVKVPAGDGQVGGTPDERLMSSVPLVT